MVWINVDDEDVPAAARAIGRSQMARERLGLAGACIEEAELLLKDARELIKHAKAIQSNSP